MSEQNTKKEDTQVTFFIPNTDALGRLETMQPDFSLTMKYKTIEEWMLLKDKPIRCFYMGLRPIPNENGEVVNCGVFVTKHECFISGQMLLIEAVQHLEPKTAIEITFLGRTKNKSSEGMTCTFNVVKLA
jgi:hypothetical protein